MKHFLMKTILLLCVFVAQAGSVMAQGTYVKWKKVDFSTLQTNDVVAIVDLTTGLAMTNDKDDKAPDAVAVDLNYDKDRITGDVAEKLQWTFTAGTGGGGTFATNDKNLYADSKGLKVGSGSSDNVFDISTVEGNDYLHIALSSKDYIAGVEESMFSNSWKLKEVKEDKADDAVKDTRIAFFKKVEDSQVKATIKFPVENYEISVQLPSNSIYSFEQAESNPYYNSVYYESSNPDIATVVNSSGQESQSSSAKYLKIKKYGTIQLIARLAENATHDKADTVCTVRINYKNATDKGTEKQPFTVAQAKELAENGSVTISGQTYTLEADRCYFIKGVVNKVNSGMMAMFGDLGLDEMMGDDMDMEERMGDMDDFDMSEMGDMGGMDLASMIPGLGSTEGVTYYISDDGTKDNRLKVVNGRGLVTLTAGEGTTYTEYKRATFDKLDDLSPGDEVLVYGPLVYTEDNNMFGGMMGGNQGGEQQDDPDENKTAKVGELNYLHKLTKVLLVEDQRLYGKATKNLKDDRDFFYWLDHNPKVGTAQTAQVKCSDEEIAKWVYTNDEKTDSVFTAVGKGNAKVTVKVKVIVQEKDPNDESSKEKSYTMKRKFNLEVLPIDKDPEGKNIGEYRIVTYRDNSISKLVNGARLLFTGLKMDEDGEDGKYYILQKDDAMMGGGKNGKEVTVTQYSSDIGNPRIYVEDVPQNAQEILLEKDNEGYFYFNVGKNENGEKLYLYASDTSEDQEESSESESGFDFSGLMDMLSPSTGLKVGTKEAVGDSCKATISIPQGSNEATIQFPVTVGKKNTLMMSNAFDMDALSGMFSSGDEEESGDGNSSAGNNSSTGSSSSSSFYMPSFNTLKDDDEKGIKIRIFVFEQELSSYKITIGSSGWMTLVSDYNAMAYTDAVEAYIVTKVTQGSTKSWASLEAAPKTGDGWSKIKAGVPYLLHAAPGTYEIHYMNGNFETPEGNLLQISDATTTGSKTESSVYVLAKKSNGVGFYRWTGGDLGSGRVYLSHDARTASSDAREFISFDAEEISTGIQTIDNGQLTIDNDAPAYNLNGQQVTKNYKGIVIQNGKKRIK